MSIQIIHGDSRNMGVIERESVHLVVTSPPYNIKMGYDTHDDNMDPGDYLQMLDDVWVECHRVLVPGGRIAVNVPFQVFTKPAYPLAAYITLQLAERFDFLNTVVWEKPGKCIRCSFGSFRSPSAPFIRDSTESILIAKKPGDFVVPGEVLVAGDNGCKYSPLLDSETFLELTKDVWVMSPAVPKMVSEAHPAAFPTILPERLIRLYSFPGATVLDPFAGSGTTGQAAKNLGLNAILVDISPNYCSLMRDRLLRQRDLFEEDQ